MTTLTILPTMTVQEVCDAFAATWPGLKIEFFEAEPGYYKDLAEAYRLEPSRVIRQAKDAPELTVRGDMDESGVRDLIYLSYFIEVEVKGTAWRETLDAAVDRLNSRG